MSDACAPSRGDALLATPEAMAVTHAILGFLNSDEGTEFALTNAPLAYLKRLRSGEYASRWIEPDATWRWAVPACGHAQAVALRDHWNSAPTSQVLAEIEEFSVPIEVIRGLENETIGEVEDHTDGHADALPSTRPPSSTQRATLELIAEHGECAVLRKA